MSWVEQTWFLKEQPQSVLFILCQQRAPENIKSRYASLWDPTVKGILLLKNDQGCKTDFPKDCVDLGLCYAKKTEL